MEVKQARASDIVTMVPEDMHVEGDIRLSAPQNQEVHYSREAHLTLKRRLYEGENPVKKSVVLASLLDYLLEVDPPTVRPLIGTLELDLYSNGDGVFTASIQGRPDWDRYPLGTLFEITSCFRAMARELELTEEEVDTLSYLLSTKARIINKIRIQDLPPSLRGIEG